MSPSKWSPKDERQYKKVKQSQQERGVSADRAEEIAGRTVNKTRRQEGRTPNKSSAGTGNPRRPLDERDKRELYNRAKELDIKGRSKMNKRDLVRAIRNAK